jgi:multidrug efflux system membrane fusion protein
VVLAVGGYLFRTWLPGGGEAVKKGAAGPLPRLVRVAAVEQKPVPVQVDAVGTMEPIRTVAIRSRVDGHVTEIRVSPGDLVREGQVLFVLDQRPFRAVLNQAQAALGKDLAALHNAQEELERQTQLISRQLTTQEAFDRAKTTLEVQQQAVEVSRAAVETARLNLEFATIRAPFAGRIGKPAMDTGSFVRSTDSAPIVTINQTHPIYATFAVPQRYLTEIRARFGKAPMTVAVRVPGRIALQARGVLSFVDNAVDPATGTIVLRATCENPEEVLWPGESVSVTLILSIEPHALAVPPEAVQTGPRGTYVYVAKPDSTVEYRPVTVDRVVADSAVISQGLAAGERVVVDGQLNLVNGARIQVVAANTEPGKRP